MRLERLLNPRSVAFIGGDAAANAISQCQALGFEGDMWPVNPSRPVMCGLATVPSIADLPGPPDAAFVGINRHDAIAEVAALASIGTGVAVCYASGFAETGAEGAVLQDQLVTAAGGMPLIGPNCYGTISATSGAVLWPDQQGLVRTSAGIAVVTQSGNIAVNLTMQDRSLRIGHVITLGNQCDVGIEECIDVLVDDPAVTALALHIEALNDVAAFCDAVARAHQRRIPIVALKTGSSDSGAAIAVSHTSSLVGNDAAYSALFDRLGVVRVHSIPELLDTMHVLDALGPLRGKRLASLSCSGGEASLVADRAPCYDVEFAAFTPDHADRIRSTLSDLVAVTNPLDYHTFIWGDEPQLTKCFTAVLDGPLDAAVLVLDFPRRGIDAGGWWPTLRAFGAAVEATGTPGLITSTMAENMPAEARAAGTNLGLAMLTDIDSALRGLEAAAWLGRHLPQAEIMATTAIGGSNRASLDEHDAKLLLADAGVTVPRGEQVEAGRALEAAARIGYPVVLKTIGPEHKSDIGGVRTGLGDEQSVVAAVADLARLSPRILVEEHVSGLVELVVAVRHAAPVGYLLTIGAGGTLVEVSRQTRSLLLPTSARAISQALETLPIWPLLAGHRGRPGIDIDAVVNVVLCLTDVVIDHPDVVEVEVNPLIAGPDGAVAADALIITGGP
jgi:acyl-CoA synthetase (NDP forming)